MSKNQYLPHFKQRSNYVLEIGSEPSADATLFRGRVDADEDQIGLFNRLVDIGGEEEIATACLADNILQTRFVDGQGEINAVPGIDTGLVEVDNRDLDVRAFQRDDSTSWTT